MQLESSLSGQSTKMLSVLRIVLGLLFLCHGTSKFFGMPAPPPASLNFLSQLWFQGLIEMFGGAALTLGIFTRPVALILAGDMAVAYFVAHAPRAWFPHNNGGLLAVVYCFAFLYLVFAGGGAWSFDRLVRKTSD